jgi:hypothetical protein
MSVYNPRNDSPEQLNRYLLRVYQKIDKDILLLSQKKDARIPLKLLQEIKRRVQFRFQDFPCDNLDALKWDLQDHLPEYTKYF